MRGSAALVERGAGREAANGPLRDTNQAVRTTRAEVMADLRSLLTSAAGSGTGRSRPGNAGGGSTRPLLCARVTGPARTAASIACPQPSAGEQRDTVSRQFRRATGCGVPGVSASRRRSARRRGSLSRTRRMRRQLGGGKRGGGSSL